MKKINLFNRKLLIVTYDLNEQAKIRDILACNNINYTLIPFVLSPSLNRCEPEYKFYVHKEDFELAKHVIDKKM